KYGRVRTLLRWRAAACIVFLLGTGLYIGMRKGNDNAKQNSAAHVITPTDLPPGKDKAILTLGNGATVQLNSTDSTVVARLGYMQILQTGNGELVYSAGNELPAEIAFNTLTTPRGGQYKITLADGTRVRLNAASSIRFPTAFSGAKREVTIIGQAYFEVQKNPGKPFIVNAGLSKIEVLGTHFDVKAYTDEQQISATLVEGAIRFSSGNVQKVLKPDQQAKLNTLSGSISISDVNADNEIAWIRGQIYMNGTSLGDLMKQISRWYNVDVEIKAKLPQRQFQGVLHRNVNLSYVLEALNANGIKATLDGNKIVVSDK
ncbi:MAG TPA: FecR family protein, partial [Agriterribacter sp.]|nr:FecR family protein [Agriterribacter sp.]